MVSICQADSPFKSPAVYFASLSTSPGASRPDTDKGWGRHSSPARREDPRIAVAICYISRRPLVRIQHAPFLPLLVDNRKRRCTLGLGVLTEASPVSVCRLFSPIVPGLSEESLTNFLARTRKVVV